MPDPSIQEPVRSKRQPCRDETGLDGEVQRRQLLPPKLFNGVAMAANNGVPAPDNPNINLPHPSPPVLPASSFGREASSIATVNNQRDRSSAPRKQQGIRRACRECRQQKLRCEVVKEQSSVCSRCRKLQLVCKVDASFKRIEKRKIKSMQHQLDHQEAQPTAPSFIMSPSQVLSSLPNDEDSTTFQIKSPVVNLPTVPERPTDIPNTLNSTGSLAMPTHPDIIPSPRFDASELDKARPAGSVSSGVTTSRQLDGVELSTDEIQDLFNVFFNHYHQFLPFLDPHKSAEDYFRVSRLLFWTIISVASRRYASDLTLLASLSVSLPRLLWAVLLSVPQNYHDIKALCLLCTWPFPLSSSSMDPTFMLSGTMMSLAMQVGLHRPSQAQDFSKCTTKTPPDEVQDRVVTWYACKIVSQSVSTGYGQPSLNMAGDSCSMFVPHGLEARISHYLRDRSRIEAFCNRVSTSLYSMSDATHGENYPSSILDSLSQDLTQLQSDLCDKSKNIALYLKCAELHLRLYSLFVPVTAAEYVSSLLALYETCEGHLALMLDQENAGFLAYCPNYVWQMTLACGFAVHKLTESSSLDFLDATAAKKLFNSAIVAIRKTSVSNNDLPGRSAEVLVQLKARSTGQKSDWRSLQLKVRSRMSMSVMFDSLWEWRRRYELEANKARPFDIANQYNPTMQTDHTAYPSPVQQNLNLDYLAFDDFYPMNWIIENSDMSQFPVQGSIGDSM